MVPRRAILSQNGSSPTFSAVRPRLLLSISRLALSNWLNIETHPPWCFRGKCTNLLKLACCYANLGSGPTRKEAKLSEAQSYANLAAENDHWGILRSDIRSDDILIEDRALDSYHNVLFSLTLFYSRFHSWPSRITIVSHAFKKERLIDGHCAAIGFPLDRVDFVGIDPPGMAAAAAGESVGEGKEEALKGVGLAMGEWKDDPHGRGESLAGKRGRRNPWNVSQGVFASEGDTGGLVIVGKGIDEHAPRPW